MNDKNRLKSFDSVRGMLHIPSALDKSVKSKFPKKSIISYWISHQECMAQRLLSWHYENEARTKEACKEILVQLKRLHLDPVLERLKGREGAKVSFQNITNAYDGIKDDYGKKAKGAKDVIAAVFFEYHRVRKPSAA